jgi:hypothetical protein
LGENYLHVRLIGDAREPAPRPSAAPKVLAGNIRINPIVLPSRFR